MCFINSIYYDYECKILLSYDNWKWNFIAFKLYSSSIRKHIADIVVVNNVTCLYTCGNFYDMTLSTK